MRSSFLLAGLAASAALWFAGMWALVRAQAAAIRELPGPVREAPHARAEYDEALKARPSDALRDRTLYIWLAGFTLFCLVLTAFDVVLGVQILAGVGLAMYWTHTVLRERVPERPDLGRRFAVPLFITCLGFVGIALSLGQILVG
jgi:hypothetical protein